MTASIDIRMVDPQSPPPVQINGSQSEQLLALVAKVDDLQKLVVALIADNQKLKEEMAALKARTDDLDVQAVHHWNLHRAWHNHHAEGGHARTTNSQIAALRQSVTALQTQAASNEGKVKFLMRFGPGRA